MGQTVTKPEKTGMPANSVEVLAMSNTQVGNGGAAGNTSLTTYTLPGGTMGPNDALRITSLWSCDDTANAKIAVIAWDSAATDVLYCNLDNELGLQSMVMIYNANSTSAQKAFTKFHPSGVSFSENQQPQLSYTIDTSGDVVIDFRAESMTATENLYIESYVIELIRSV